METGVFRHNYSMNNPLILKLPTRSGTKNFRFAFAVIITIMRQSAMQIFFFQLPYQPEMELRMVQKNGDTFLSDLVLLCSIGSTDQHIQMATSTDLLSCGYKEALDYLKLVLVTSSCLDHWIKIWNQEIPPGFEKQTF